MVRYANGDGVAFDELFQRYERRAFSYFARRTRCRDRAQDLCQELFLRIHRARRSYDPERPFSSWFFQIAHRLLIDDERRAYRSQELLLEEVEARGSHSSADSVAECDHLARLLALLSERERYALVAAKVQSVGYHELAAQLGKSVDAVKKMVSRAAMRLRAASPELAGRGR